MTAFDHKPKVHNNNSAVTIIRLANQATGR
jgi:hypothetical protein